MQLLSASVVLQESACEQVLGAGTVEVAEHLGDAAYLTVLLIIFPLALLQGASHIAIGQLGFVFLGTEVCAPHAPMVFRMGMQYWLLHAGGKALGADCHHLGSSRATGGQSGTVGGCCVVVRRAVVASMGCSQCRLDDRCIHHSMGVHVRMRVGTPHTRSRHANHKQSHGRNVRVPEILRWALFNFQHKIESIADRGWRTIQFAHVDVQALHC
jgi:hypothetical protein